MIKKKLNIIVLCIVINGLGCSFYQSNQSFIEKKKDATPNEYPANKDEKFCKVVKPTKKELTAPEAVLLAECFIIENGYTDLPPSKDASKIMPESVHPLTDESGMASRHNSLERNAYGYFQKQSGWTVVFRYKGNSEAFAQTNLFYTNQQRELGRAVTFDLYGNSIKIQHQNFYIDFPDLVKLQP